jgi:hypothetical protein
MEDARIKKARRNAGKKGLLLRRSRRDQTWMIVDPVDNTLVVGPSKSDGTGGLPIEEVERWFAEGVRIRRTRYRCLKCGTMFVVEFQSRMAEDERLVIVEKPALGQGAYRCPNADCGSFEVDVIDPNYRQPVEGDN